MARPLSVQNLGRLAYEPAMALMADLVARRQADAVPDTLLLLEHDPVVTRPRRTPADLLLAGPEELRRRGIEVCETGRGGLITYHGPGQLVAYPLLDLRPDRCDVHRYLRDLEEVLLQVLAGFGIAGERREGRTGVWVGRSKVAALGVRVSRWVTSHGLALNVGDDLSGFEVIVPCGIRDGGVTSLSRLLGRKVTVAEAASHLVPCFCRVFDREAGAISELHGERPGRPGPREPMIPLSVLQPEPRELPRPGQPEWNHRPPTPDWLRVRMHTGEAYGRVNSLLRDHRLNTVCQEARCPNIHECWSDGTATFMIMGEICTRACSYCCVKSGRPEPLDPDEPASVAHAVLTMGLAHAVITSVDRDDVEDFGAGHFAATVRAVREASPQTTIEVLIPDFAGDEAALGKVLQARPDVLNHNTETVARLYPRLRSRGVYERCLELLRRAGEFRDAHHPGMLTKSGLMVGLGETREEVLGACRDLRAQGVDILTVGQYLRPTMKHVPVERFWTPEEFEGLRAEALDLGFRFVEAGPLVRSSYHARRHRTGALGGA